MKLQDLIDVINSTYDNRRQEGADEEEACRCAIRVAACVLGVGLYVREARSSITDRYRAMIQKILAVESEQDDSVVADALTNLAPEMRRLLGEDAGG